MFEPGDLVKVTNQGNNPLTIQYGNRAYPLLPDKETHIPFEAAVLWFGDPRATTTTLSVRVGDQLYIIPDRESEVRRLCARYGMTAGDSTDFLGEAETVPRVKVVSLEGEDFVSVIDDPKGENVAPVQMSVADSANRDEVIRKQQQQIDFLMEQMRKLDGSTTESTFEEEDSNPNIPLEDDNEEPLTPPPARGAKQDIPEDTIKF